MSVIIGDDQTGTPLPGTLHPVKTYSKDGEEYQPALLCHGLGELDDIKLTAKSSPLPINTACDKINSSSVTVTTAGIAQRILAGWHCKVSGRVDIRANSTNTGIVCVGSSNVNALSTPPVGVYLSAGESYCFEIEDIYDVWADASVSGEGASFNYFSNMVPSLS